MKTTISAGEVKIVERDGRKSWVCSRCGMETPMLDEGFHKKIKQSVSE